MRRLKARRALGQRNGYAQAKSNLGEGTEANTTKSLNRVQRLLKLPETTSLTDRDSRLKNVVDFRGIKVCFRVNINNITGKSGSKFFFNWAIVSPKQLDASITSLPVEEFFRGQGTNGRSVDFSATLSGMDLHCLPINTDKYIVHRHKRFIMGPYESTEGKATKYFETYVPVKRQVVYNSVGTAEEQTFPEARDMWMIWWGAYMDEPTLDAGIMNAYTTQFRIVRYFREPKRT